MIASLLLKLLALVQSHFLPLTPPQATLLLLIAGFALGSAVMFYLTRGKEFAITGLSAAAFILPFVQLG